MRETIQSFLTNRSFLAGLILVLVLVVLAVLAGVIAPEEKVYRIDLKQSLQPPSLSHPFGTDHLGRDVFARVIHGIRIAFRIVLVVVVVESLIGVPLGILAGYWGGRVENVISGLTDTVWAFPPIVLALGIVLILGPSILVVALAIAAVSWAPFTKTIQGKTKSIMTSEYIDATRALGASALHIIVRHILPNVAPTALVLAALTVPSAILSATSLSFLGLGAQQPMPEWGLMISEGKDYLLKAPWIVTFPGIFIVLMSLAFNLLSDGLRDILDPRLKTL